MNILITTAEWKSALTCMRSLAKAGHSISLISQSPYTPSLYSKFCKESIISPKESDKNEYMDFIQGLIKSRKYDLLIPISDLCTEYFSESREDLSKYVNITMPSKEAIDIARNKDKTYRFCQQNNIPIPDTNFISGLSDVDNLKDKISFPCVVKQPKGTGGRGNQYIENKEDFILKFKSFENNNILIVQEFIKGRFFGMTAVCNRGEIISFFMFEVLRQYPDKDGITVYARSYYNSQGYEVCADLVKKLDWSGPIDFDCFIVEGRGVVLLEINPRFSGTIQFAYSCGIDLPLDYLKLALGESQEHIQQRKYKTGLRYRSVFPEEIYSCLSNKKYIASFILNFLRPNTRYDFSLTDRGLLLWQLKAVKWHIFN